ncbi:hypothetical protein BGZ65_002991 [Modicella reniformis]|uniref:Uncharacterized protein n=1 Tax=Modicella reniformis TaxID=1440133 RepID=A0A9P6SNC9_9FUNG|nr:hypothetical protein BGZ65_002991 [Modicella reniformis]
MERQSEKEKKKFAKHSWCHFKCLEIPDIMTKIPIHLIRGQVDLLDKDKVRLEKVIKLGVGGSWSQIVDQHKKSAKEEEEAAVATGAGGPTTRSSSSKKSKDTDMDLDDDDDMDEDVTGSSAKDFTAQLTGEVDRKSKHNNKTLKPNTKGAKVEKKKMDDGKKGFKNTKGAPVTTAKGPSKGKNTDNNNKGAKSSGPGKPMSAVEKAIAASRAESKKKLEQMQTRFGKK